MGFFYFWYSTHQPAPVSAPTEKPISFLNMAKSDKDRIIEIVNGVVEDITPATKELRQELNVLFAKYNMTDEEIEFFRIAGPGFAWQTYDTFFFMDALESVKTGIPVKSEARADLEGFALTFDSITPDMIKMQNQEIEKIAKKEPSLNSPNVLTEDDIKGLLNYAKIRLARLGALFDK